MGPRERVPGPSTLHRETPAPAALRTAQTCKSSPAIIPAVTVVPDQSAPAFSLNDLLVYMSKQQASDLHLKPMRPPLVRVQGKLIPIKSEPLRPADLERMLLPILNRAQKEKFDQFQSDRKSVV